MIELLSGFPKGIVAVAAKGYVIKRPLSPEFLAYVHAPDRTVRDVMSAPAIIVAEDTDVSQIARVLTKYHIKRVSVVRQGRIVGIVNRADLVRALAKGPMSATPN